MDSPIIDLIIPVHNEADSISLVLEDIPKSLVRNIIVCNNHSTDDTKINALQRGAIVVDEVRKGYGYACLKGMEYIEQLNIKPDIVVFIDGDYSDYPEQMYDVVHPILENQYDLVIGSRVLGNREKGAMMPQQIFGNWLATRLIALFFRYKFTDLGPFRAINYSRLLQLNMSDKTFGWTVEMQVKAAKHGLKCFEVPVNYRKRIGVSKVSGTVKGTFLAGYKILWTIFKYM
ncbi:MAG: glycosyltransferase family 2 protein [Saprospiraceae bacterium]